MSASETQAAPNVAATASRTAMPVLFALSLSHFLNDMLQQLVPAIYPIIKPAYNLDYGQIGLITFAFQLCASEEHHPRFCAGSKDRARSLAEDDHRSFVE